MSAVLTVIAIVVVGVLVGVELAVAVFVNPILDRLPDDGGLAARSDGARVLGRVMPFWYFLSVALAVVVAVAVQGAAPTTLAVAAAALLATTVVLAITVLVPINDQVKTWSTGDHPADWKVQVRRWDRWHVLRVALITAAFALLATVPFT